MNVVTVAGGGGGGEGEGESSINCKWRLFQSDTGPSVACKGRKLSTKPNLFRGRAPKLR